jgi:hypothetical protein
MRRRYLLAVVIDAVIVAASFYVLRPVQTCTGDPPVCYPHPYFGLLRFSILVVGIVVFLALLALSATDQRTRKSPTSRQPVE